MLRRFILAILMSFAVGACQQSVEEPNPPEVSVQEEVTAEAAPPLSETERFNQWLDEQFNESLDFSPMAKAYLGIKDDDYSKMDAMTLASEQERLDWLRSSIAKMQSDFDRDALSEDAKLSFDLWAYNLATEEAASEFPYHDYLFEQMNGAQSSLPQFMIQFHKVDTRQDARDYISRLHGLASTLNNLMDRTETAAAEGIRAPKFAAEEVIEQATKVTQGAPFDDSGADSPILADARAKFTALVDNSVITDTTRDTMLDGVQVMLTGPVAKAYDRIIEWHTLQLETLEEPQGVHALPNGLAYYDMQLARNTTTSLTAVEVHEIGLGEVARLRGEMEELKKSVKFRGNLKRFFEHVRTDDQFFFPDTDEGREGYLQGARDFIGSIEEKLPDWFGLLPKAELVVRRVEAFREQDGAAQHYYPPAPDGSRPGIYYAHLSDMSSMPKNQMEVIAYHEGLPGHHMQIAIAQELKDMPKFRTQAFYTAYTEGWALYAEQLAKEMGAYEDPYSEFGRLSSEMFRAIRLVVDTGLHAKQWTEEEAVEYFLANSPEPEEGIRSEVRRYLIWPGQATGYKIGMIEILKLREEAMTALGDEFDIRAFHDVVLGGGALPMAVLESRIDRWVSEMKEN